MKSNLIPSLLLGCVLTLWGQGLQAADLIKDSPFLPNGALQNAPTATPRAEQYQFAGVATFGNETLVSIFDTQKRIGRWISVGQDSDGIAVKGYDAVHNTVALQIEGKNFLLGLREAREKGTGDFAANIPAAIAVPLVGNVPTLKPSEEHEAKEARMLVQDLLEIGMQQRAAYEAAHRQPSSP